MAPGAQHNWGITGVTGGKDLRLIPDQKLKLGQQYHDAKGKANGLQGKASCVMGGMQFLSPTQQCQGAAEAVPGLGTGTTRTESRREQGEGSEIHSESTTAWVRKVDEGLRNSHLPCVSFI